MIRFITLITAIMLGTISTDLLAQNKKKVPCFSEEYSHFNFWLGDWQVFNTKGKLIGTNHVVKVPNACAIQENWDSTTSSNLGTSYNFYSAATKKWHQVWVDNSGFSLFLKGSFADNKMVLRSDLQENSKEKFYHRITWVKNNDGSVTQVWDYMTPENKISKEVFRGIYKKKDI